jgi:hypothetical protein
MFKIFAAKLLFNFCMVVVANYYSKRVSDRKLNCMIFVLCFRSVGLNELHYTASVTRNCYLVCHFKLKLQNLKSNAVNFESGSPSTPFSVIKWLSGTK